MAVPQSSPYECSPVPTSLSLGFGAVRPSSLQAGNIPITNASTQPITVSISSTGLSNIGSLNDLLVDHSVEFGVVDYAGWVAGKSIAPTDPMSTTPPPTMVIYARPGAGSGAMTGGFRLAALPSGATDPGLTLVTLNGTEEVNPPVARVALVLDRSGSMSVASGLSDGSTRLDVLKPAVKTAVELLGPNDEIAMVSFASTPTTEDFDSTSSSQVYNTVQNAEAQFEASVDSLTASGMTGIGLALQAGLAAIPATTGIGRALIVFSDGIHNTGVHPSAVSLDGTPVYSVGLGPGSDPTLAGLALATSHMHQVIDTLVGDEGLFYLDKFFAQAILDIVGQVPVIDPVVRIRPGERFELEVPFTLFDSLARFVAIARFPRLLTVELRAPSGETISAQQAASWVAVELEAGERIQSYSVDLSRVIKHVKQAVGTWRMILSINEGQFKEVLGALRRDTKTYADYKLGGVPVALHAYARSALDFRFEAAPVPTGLPAKLFLRAEVSVGGQAYADSKLVIHVRSPDRQDRWKLEPKRIGDGTWLIELDAKWPGVYEFLGVVHGETFDGARFRRERLLTVQVRATDPVGAAPNEPAEPNPDDGASHDCGGLCKQVLELLRNRKAVSLLTRAGYDVNALALEAKQSCRSKVTKPSVLIADPVRPTLSTTSLLKPGGREATLLSRLADILDPE